MRITFGGCWTNVIALILCALIASAAQASGWRDASHLAQLQNDRIEATFQAGVLIGLKDRLTGDSLLTVDPTALPHSLPIFGPSCPIDLDACEVTIKRMGDSIESIWTTREGLEYRQQWRIEPHDGDLILNTSAKVPTPVGEIRQVFMGCDIGKHALVTPDASNPYGACRTIASPWRDAVVGDPLTAPRPMKDEVCPQAVVALFQGATSGWFLEGREDDAAPTCLMLQGCGSTANIGLVRAFSQPTTTPRLFEIRLRPYRDRWTDAVDPYIRWLETDLGFVPLARKKPAWVNEVRSHANIRSGDFDTLERLAKLLDPRKTVVGRLTDYRNFPTYTHYPDYAPSETSRKWIRRAKELGFHVGVQMDVCGISRAYPGLLKQFRPGMKSLGIDAAGQEQFYVVSIDQPYCSPAYKPWRDYLVAQMREAVEAGAEMIYLYDHPAPAADFLVDGRTAAQGTLALEKELLSAYPHVAIEAQPNLVDMRYASFGLCPYFVPPGHRLMGYIFSPFARFLAEGHDYAPTLLSHMDSMESWGFALPGAHEPGSSLQIAKAFQDLGLSADPMLPLGAGQLSGYSGRDGIKAYFEKQETERALVVHVPGSPPRAIGKRHFGIASWSGPGTIRDWPVYRGKTILALDRTKTYAFDEPVDLPADGFHISDIPDDFALADDSYLDFHPEDAGHEVGRDRSYYRVKCSGHGQMCLTIPVGYLAFLNGKEVKADPSTLCAQLAIDASPEQPSEIIAFGKVSAELSGYWVDLPWQTPPGQRSWHISRHIQYTYPADGPAAASQPVNGLRNYMRGRGIIIGRLPAAPVLRIQGSYSMCDEPQSLPGDGVLRLNGQEVLRIKPGNPPYSLQPFDVDGSAFSGQDVMLEFSCEGKVGPSSYADWFKPRIVVGPQADSRK